MKLNYDVRFLSGYALSDIYPVFMKAFGDYVRDVSHITEYSFINRAIKNGVDFDLSVGAFDGDEMVGFTLVGTDDHEMNNVAFDAATGIITEHRGKGLAKRMFDFAEPRLRKEGLERFILEVMQENIPAIKAYQKVGFAVERELISYELSFERARLDQKPGETIEIHGLPKKELSLYAEFFDWQPSWENSLSSIARIENEVLLLGARYQGMRAGILVYYPMLNWILCLAVHKDFRRQYVASSLLAYLVNQIEDKVNSVKLINVQGSDEGMRGFIEKVGFKHYFSQYEMYKEMT